MNTLHVVLVVVLMLLSLPVRAASPAAEEVQALFERWQKAQNERDFAAYQGLYAERFTGVRRSGLRVVRLDRAGWMKDRGRMFQHNMKVEIASPHLTVAAGSAVVQFRQTFSQGSYKDSGPKLLSFHRDGSGAFRIVREEMLRSELNLARATLSAPYLHLCAEGAVLHEGAPDDWGQGAPQLVKLQDPTVAQRPVDSAKLPEVYRAFLNQPISLRGLHGESCTATVTGFSLVVRIDEHSSTMQVWKGESEDDEGKRRRRRPVEVAREAMELGRASQLLVAKLDTAACGSSGLAATPGLSFGRGPAAVPATVKVLPAQVADAAWTQAALRATRRLPEYGKALLDGPVDSADQEQTPPPTYWDEYHSAHREVRVMERGDGTRLVSAALWLPGPCAERSAVLWALWEVTGSGRAARFKLLGTRDRIMIPVGAVDLDGDGREELLTDDGVLWRDGEGVGRLQELEMPSFGCDC